MGRRTGDETRALLLRVGMQLLLERGVSAGVQHIRLQDVLRHAAVSYTHLTLPTKRIV